MERPVARLDYCGFAKHTRRQRHARGFWRGGLAKEQGAFTSERAVAGGSSVLRHATLFRVGRHQAWN
jgi:hypothetical protein